MWTDAHTGGAGTPVDHPEAQAARAAGGGTRVEVQDREAIEMGLADEVLSR